jgi:hypothetical protein
MKTFKHDLSHTWMGTCKLGQIIPCGQTEILPNDILQIKSNGVVKFGTLAKPLLHNLKAKLVVTFTPIRQVLDTDDHWEDFITGGRDGNDATTLDTVSSSATAGTVDDYNGVKPVAGTNNLLAYPRRCYNAFYNNFIIDDEIQTEISEDNNTIQYVNWAKDYFTTARTSPQLGTAVNITIGTSADVTTAGTNNINVGVYHTGSSDYVALDTDGSAGGHVALDTASTVSSSEKLYANLSGADGMSIDDFKLAMAANKFQENRAKYGARLIEYVKFLGGNIGDRLERPEIVSISSANVSVSEIFNTNSASNYLGDQAGFAIAGLDSRKALKWFPEHGYLSFFFWIIPDSIYMDGCPRYMLRQDKEDFYTPEYANVMMQPVKKGEIYFQGTAGGTADGETFGYTDNYRDYKEGRNIITSGFRADYDDEHLGRQFSSLPTLNSAFLSTSGTIREADIFQQTATDNVRIIMRHQIKGRRIVVPKTNYTFTRMS